VHLPVVVPAVELADDSEVRLVRAGLDHGAGRAVGAAELAGAEYVAVDGDELELRHAGGANDAIEAEMRAGPTRPA